MLTDNCYIAHTASMIRKSVLKDNNIKYEEFYTPAEDYRLWTKLMDVTAFHNIPDVLVKYRVQQGNTSHKQKNNMKLKAAFVRNEVSNSHIFLRKEFEDMYKQKPKIKIRLFGFIPLIKIKNNKVYLFECLPILKIKRS